MKTMIAIAIAGMAVSANGQELLSWWNFNNTNNDSDLLNSTGDDNARSNFGHMLDNDDPFDSGFYDDANGRLYGVADGFSGSPGALVTVVDPGPGVPNAANYGAFIDINGLNGDNFASGTAGNWGSFSGTSTNRPDGGTFSGGSLAVTGDANNGSFFDIVADLSGWQDIEVSWANRGTSTGFSERVVQVSTDGVNFTTVFQDLGALSSSWTVESADAGSLLDGASNAIIRFGISGASSTSGNNRFDNIQLLGTAIPAPASAALLALGGLVATRRR